VSKLQLSKAERGIHKLEFFMITPHMFDPSFNDKRDVVERLSSVLGIDVLYAPYQPSSDEFDIGKTFEMLKRVDFFVADLSYERPSCYFEVGFVQAMNRLINLIAVDGTNIHQVLNKDKIKYYAQLYDYEKLIESIIRFQMLMR